WAADTVLSELREHKVSDNHRDKNRKESRRERAETEQPGQWGERDQSPQTYTSETGDQQRRAGMASEERYPTRPNHEDDECLGGERLYEPASLKQAVCSVEHPE